MLWSNCVENGIVAVVVAVVVVVVAVVVVVVAVVVVVVVAVVSDILILGTTCKIQTYREATSGK